MYLNVLLEASFERLLVFRLLFRVCDEGKVYGPWLKVSTGVEGCKTKSFHRQIHAPAVPAPRVQPFDVVCCLPTSTANQSPS